jgi:hypothetical protein
MPKHHTRKRHLRKSEKHEEEALTIPELRRAFEHIELFAMTHKDDVKALQEEWKKVFYKELDKQSAEAYLQHVKTLKRGRTLRKSKQVTTGGASPLGGAPIDYTTRPGLYISPGINQGSYAQVPAYVASGFWNPEMGISYDPVKGQPSWPVPYASTGSNLVTGGTAATNVAAAKPVITGGDCGSCGSCAMLPISGGKRNTRRKLRRGGDLKSYLQGMGMRTFGSSVPMTRAQSLEAKFNGTFAGDSPSAADNRFTGKL